MRQDVHLGRARRSLALVGTCGVMLGLSAAPGWALGLTTSTVASSSPVAIAGTQSATVTATVSPLLVLLPQTVTFTNSATNTVLSSATPSLQCALSLKPCSFTTTVAAKGLVAGQNAIVAKYSGNLLEAPSQATAYLYKGSATTCTAEEGSCYASATSADGAAEGTIFTQSPGSGQETITIGFGTAPLPCTTPGTGETMAFNVTNAGGAKSIRYEVFGAAAEAANAAHPGGYVCYESPKAFTTASGKQAAHGSNGMYYGVLPTCVGGEDEGPASNPPCLQFGYYFNGETGPAFVDYLEVPESDPRVSN